MIIPQQYAAFGPGKVILLGEHGVVYGQPALAAAISRGIVATGRPAKRCALVVPQALGAEHQAPLRQAFTKAARAVGSPKVEVTLASDLPVSMGLGSSGALAVACARLLLQASGEVPRPPRVNALALLMEKEFHGTPSGVDHTTSGLGGVVLFQRGRAKSLPIKRPLKVLVALVGERPPTKATVAALRARQARWPRAYRRIFSEVGKVATDGAQATRQGDYERLGDLMNINHGLLVALQLSSDRVDSMVRILRAHGALGAKLTGAGGDGGAVVGLFWEPEPVVALLLREGIKCFSSQLGGPRAL